MVLIVSALLSAGARTPRECSRAPGRRSANTLLRYREGLPRKYESERYHVGVDRY